ncbi:unnamed protein product [Penicillium nalgiovense]|uniref:Uncharacterized protein n=1 Tax=Penicillium nalgiovense TaxID=60175 RepID=A0A9W4MNT3_PENNA|nr:unnamed protein product [Penicillium nalgiovense]CAG7955076.1 unnamed protein product [Penicillium nalgiovense]CAG7957816.1 unnamed protein product [Penicillium nalgiovense]CAG7961989.1 unnamed protein product [Penicillium nalgiovense]CAG7967311.1 unnamed protein product [Penicillium nalgiovense]
MPATSSLRLICLLRFESSPVLLAEYLCHVRRQEPEWIPDGSKTWEFADTLEEMHDWILQPFLPIFQELGSLDPNRKYCLFAEELHYTVQVVGNKVVPVYRSNTKHMKHHVIGARLPSSVDYSMFPIYHPRVVHVPISADSAALPGVPRKVFIHGQPQPSFVKIVYGGDARITSREIVTYSKIHMTKFDSPILTSQLEGLV